MGFHGFWLPDISFYDSICKICFDVLAYFYGMFNVGLKEAATVKRPVSRCT